MGEEDQWRWEGSSAGMYSVKAGYGLFEKTNQDENPNGRIRGELDKIWKVVAPLKAKVTAWRALRDRLPTRDNLARRLVIPVEEQKCSCCNLHTESSEHFFLRCEEAEKVWGEMLKWIGVGWAAPKGLNDHFTSFSGMLGESELRKRMGGLWVCVVWALWKWRNNVIFDNGSWEVGRIVEEVKCRFWSWCVIKGFTALNTSFSEWSGTTLSIIWSQL